MDLYDRKIIGYAYGKSMTADLALEAVKNACLNVSDTNGIILHSDLGSQYTSELFEEYMRTNGFVHSFYIKTNRMAEYPCKTPHWPAFLLDRYPRLLRIYYRRMSLDTLLLQEMRTYGTKTVSNT